MAVRRGRKRPMTTAWMKARPGPAVGGHLRPWTRPVGCIQEAAFDIPESIDLPERRTGLSSDAKTLALVSGKTVASPFRKPWSSELCACRIKRLPPGYLEHCGLQIVGERHIGTGVRPSRCWTRRPDTIGTPRSPICTR